MSAHKLPEGVRALIARAMGYADESSLLYWGTGGAGKRFDDTCAALATLWPAQSAESDGLLDEYRNLRNRMETIASSRSGGTFGILIDQDGEALAYQEQSKKADAVYERLAAAIRAWGVAQ